MYVCMHLYLSLSLYIYIYIYTYASSIYVHDGGAGGRVDQQGERGDAACEEEHAVPVLSTCVYVMCVRVRVHVCVCVCVCMYVCMYV